MKKLSRKILTAEEAEKRMANLFQALSMHFDNINYWRAKIGKPLDFSDTFILGTDKLKSPEEFIEKSIEKIEEIRWKIYNDYARYGNPHKARMLVG